MKIVTREGTTITIEPSEGVTITPAVKASPPDPRTVYVVLNGWCDSVVGVYDSEAGLRKRLGELEDASQRMRVLTMQINEQGTGRDVTRDYVPSQHWPTNHRPKGEL